MGLPHQDKTKHTFISQFLLLDLWWMQHIGGRPYHLYMKHTATTVGQHTICASTESSAYLCLQVMHKGTYFSKSVYIGYTNRSTTPLWVR